MMNGNNQTEWWRGAVFYQIYPRSFFDSDDNGIGDLSGITEKLDYISSLGVDALWISPFFKSPMADFGYDVSDYRAVDPIFGHLANFQKLLEQTHEKGLKVIIDMVLNHTSIEHPWFSVSRRDKINAKSDWYVWADPKPDGTPPNNWMSIFGGPAWTFESRRGQYYMHSFLKEQPDLNFHNPDVQDAILNECRFWLDLGVDGFRLDAVNHYFHDTLLRDNPPRASNAAVGTQIDFPDPYNMQSHVYDKSRPENLAFIERLRAMADSYGDIMTVGEVGDEKMIERSIEYSQGNKRLHTAYSFTLLGGHVPSSRFIKDAVENFEAQGQDSWPSWAFCNHDVIRVVTRWGKDNDCEHDPRFAKLLITLLCSLRGTIFMYQGEELGLPDAIIPYEKIQDPWGKTLWPEWQGRDGCRTPIPWKNGDMHAGFSHTEPWLPVPDTHHPLAVDIQEKNDNSVLAFTRRFLNWRKTQHCLLHGNIEFVETGNTDILCFSRSEGNNKITACFNLSKKEQNCLLNGLNTGDIRFNENDQSPVKDKETGALMLPAFGFCFL